SVVEPIADLAALSRRGIRRVVLAGGQLLVGPRHEQVPRLDAVGLLPLDEALRPREPAAGGPQVAAGRKRHPGPERGPRRAQAFAAANAVISSLDIKPDA